MMIAEATRFTYSCKASIVGEGIIRTEPNSSIQLGSDGVIVSPSEIYVEQRGRPSIGDHINVGAGVNIRSNRNIVIGHEPRIGQSVSIAGSQYGYGEKAVKIRLQPLEKATVRIAEDARAGPNSVVLPGVSIGDGAIRGASSIVSNLVPPYAIAVGSPMPINIYPNEPIQRDRNTSPARGWRPAPEIVEKVIVNAKETLLPFKSTVNLYHVEAFLLQQEETENLPL